jgi:hypothetical protein
MSDGLDELCKAGARLLTSLAAALDEYTELQKRRFEYVSQQVPSDPEPAFEEFQPGYFEVEHGKQVQRNPRRHP